MGQTERKHTILIWSEQEQGNPPSSPPTLSTHYKRIIVNVDNKVIDTINYDKIVTPPKLPIRRSRRLSLEPLKPLDVSIIKKKPKNKKKKR